MAAMIADVVTGYELRTSYGSHSPVTESQGIPELEVVMIHTRPVEFR